MNQDKDIDYKYLIANIVIVFLERLQELCKESQSSELPAEVHCMLRMQALEIIRIHAPFFNVYKEIEPKFTKSLDEVEHILYPKLEKNSCLESSDEK